MINKRKKSTMTSHYSELNRDQIKERQAAFHEIFPCDEKGDYEKTTKPSSKMHLVADYIGYLMYQALRLQHKYKNKHTHIMDYLTSYRHADKAAAIFIHSFGMEAMQSINPLAFRLMHRFINTDSL